MNPNALMDRLDRIADSLEEIVRGMQGWSSAPEARMAKALERIADVLEANQVDKLFRGEGS